MKSPASTISSTKPSLNWLKNQSRAVRQPVLWAIGLGLGSGLLLIVQSSLLAHIISAVVFGASARAPLRFAFMGLIGIIVVRSALAWAVERAGFGAASAVKLAVRDQLMAHLETLGPARQRGLQTGDVVNAATDGVEQLQAYYGRYLPQTALALLVPLAILAVVLPIDWLSGLILLFTAPLIPVFMALIGRGAERLNQRQWRRMGILSGHFLDALQGLTTLKLFNLGSREARLIARLSDDYRRSTMAVLRVAFLSSLVLEFLATVSIAMVAVLIGFRLMWGEIDFECGFLVLLLAPEFYLPLRNMGSVYHARMEAIGAAERLVMLFDTPAVDWPGQRRDVIALNAPPHLCAEALSYDYPDGTRALDAVSFDLAPGETVAVIGPSGAGKSTLGLVLLGLLRPQRGALLINDVALDAIAIDHWRQAVAWVPQQPRLFFGSVRDNLCLGRRPPSDARLWDVLQQAQARDFVAALPQGLDTEIGERGLRLSGGEAQRLAIARALVKDAPFVVVDEISAHLDAERENRLLLALQTLRRGRSMLMIAHRLASVRAADRIVVLNGGRMVEYGAPAALQRAGGLYARLLQSGASELPA